MVDAWMYKVYVQYLNIDILQYTTIRALRTLGMCVLHREREDPSNRYWRAVNRNTSQSQHHQHTRRLDELQNSARAVRFALESRGRRCCRRSSTSAPAELTEHSKCSCGGLVLCVAVTKPLNAGPVCRLCATARHHIGTERNMCALCRSLTQHTQHTKHTRDERKHKPTPSQHRET